MTLLADSVPSPGVAEMRRVRPVGPTRVLRQHSDMAALLLALAVLMGPVVQGAGGRDQHMLALGLVAVIPAVVLGQVWRLGWRMILLALGPGLGALLVCTTAPTGWAGAGDVARFLYAGLLWLSVRRIANGPDRRALLLVALSIGGLWQFNEAYLPWWGRGDASHAMSGSFYAPNVFAAYMAGTGLSAMALSILGPPRLRLVGLVAAPFCLAAVAFSASRATVGLTVAACTLTGVLLAARRSWRELGRWTAVLAAAVGLATLLGSSLLMAHGADALSGASSKSNSSSQTLASSGGVRLEWWTAATQVGAEHPLSGAGFGSFATAESRFQRADSERSVYAHNVLLQAWADGGLALGIPVSLAMLSLAIALWRRAWSRETAALAGLMGAGVMATHALVDFDAQYPACLALACVLAALSAAVPRQMEAARGSGSATPVAATCLMLVAILAIASAVRFDAADRAYRQGDLSGGAWTGADGPFRDTRFDLLRLRQGKHDPALLQRTQALQSDNVEVAWNRAVGLAVEGRADEARALAVATWKTRAARQPVQVLGFARVLAALGEADNAAGVLVVGFRQAVARPGSGGDALVLLEGLARQGRVDLVQCLIPQLPARLTTAAQAPASASCRATLRPFEDAARS